MEGRKYKNAPFNIGDRDRERARGSFLPGKGSDIPPEDRRMLDKMIRDEDEGSMEKRKGYAKGGMVKSGCGTKMAKGGMVRKMAKGGLMCSPRKKMAMGKKK